jgi:glutathione synthase/RimK-type ligase-like ATP-grasp enzyme
MRPHRQEVAGDVVIVLHGLRSDAPLDDVRRVLQARRAPHLFLDQTACADVAVETVGDRLALRVGDQEVPMGEVSGIYLRPYDLGETAPEAERARLRQLSFDLREWAQAAPAGVRVVNRPDAGLSNHSKPRQALVIAEVGFAVPEALLTTDPDAAAAFVAEHGRVIVKSCSGTRSIVRLIGAGESLDAVRWCPTQFQRFVPGVEYRVHVVGSSVFAHRVRSDAVDYRYGGFTLERTELPAAVAQKCRLLAASLGLELAGIDLRFGSDGQWYCWEANTSPAYSSFDGADHAIATALAELLTGRS